jgi:putative Mn2+ efflux pump MntP
VVAKLIALVLPLGLDTFAVAAAIGMIGVTSSTRTQVTALFTAFEAAMPLIGLALGAPLGHAIGGAAEYVAIGVLIVFGIYTLTADDDDERIVELAQMRGLRAVALGLSISFDELSIGFTLGLLHISAALVIVLIAVQTVIVTQLGLRLGSRLGERIREGAERLAGLALATLGLVLLATRTRSRACARPPGRVRELRARRRRHYQRRGAS